MTAPANTEVRQGLNGFARNVTSQYGEDGIVARALEVIGAERKWCVEFGAWDGMHLSNTYDLIRSRGYSAVLIEGEARRFVDLRQRFAANPAVIPLNGFVGFGREDSLDAMLAGTPIPRDFDVLSIDIDGNDYHVWEAVVQYRPRLVVIEFNPSIPTGVEFVQAKDMGVAQGSSLTSLDALARRKGYQLIATTHCNAVFVEESLFPRFGITDNSVKALRVDEAAVMHLFQGFDGTLFLRGCQHLIWHGVDIRESDLQQLPRFLRGHPAGIGRWRRRILNWYRKHRANDRKAA